MKRRDFLKYLSGIPFVGSLFATGQSGASEGQRECGLDRLEGEMVFICEPKPTGTHGWRFYINDEEIDGSRAVDEHGALHWPFQGAKDGDLCTARSPK